MDDLETWRRPGISKVKKKKHRKKERRDKKKDNTKTSNFDSRRIMSL